MTMNHTTVRIQHWLVGAVQGAAAVQREQHRGRGLLLLAQKGGGLGQGEVDARAQIGRAHV